MKTTEYLSAVKAKLALKSDYGLAKVLRVPPNLLSKYQGGKVVPGPIVAFRIAMILGEQEAAVVADLERERAEKMGKDADAEEWTAVISKIGRGAASILLALGVSGFPNADAGLRQLSTDAAVYTSSQAGKRRRRKAPQAGPWDGLKRRVAAARQALSVLQLPCPIPAHP